MKNIGPFLAFNEQWFAKNQRWLLWLLNAPVLKVCFRWVLRIRKDSCPLNVKITELGPNRFSYGDRLFLENGEWKLERTTDFRSHPKFGKRMYYAFRPVWWAIHFWDWAVADRFIPGFSYGFSTLTANPAAGNNSPIDGYVMRDNFGTETFGTLAAGSGTTTSTTGATIVVSLAASTTTNQFQSMRRGITLFDTSALTSGANISGAVISFRGTYKDNPLGSSDLVVVSSTPAANNALANSDYGNLGSTSFGSVAYASFSTTAYNDISLNASGISNISKTSISKFGQRLEWDRAGSFTGTWGNSLQNEYDYYSADQTGTADDPKLVVTYTTSASYTQTLTETANMTATLVKAPTRNLSQIVTITASLIKSATRNLIESFTAAATLLKTPTRNLNESATLTDVLTKAPAKNLTEASTIIDSFIKAPNRTLNESTTITDVLEKLRVKFLTLLESFIATDSVERSIGRNLTESASINDTLPRASGRSLAESAIVSDMVNKTPGRNLTESTSITDIIVRGVTKLLSEATTITASFISGIIYGRILTETITVTASVFKGITRTFTESFSVTDLLRKALNGTTTIWHTVIKPVTSWMQSDKPATNWNTENKPSTNWNSPDKP